MLKKPDACKGCPLYGDGRGFVPDEIVPGSEVFVVGQNPGGNEENGKRITGYNDQGQYEEVRCQPGPFLGKTGFQLNRKFLPLAGLERGKDVSIGNILKCRWRVGGRRVNKLPVGETYRTAVEHCMRSHFAVPGGTKLIVASGAHAFRALGGTGSIYDWRGYLLPEKARQSKGRGKGLPLILVTMHIADLFREPLMMLPTKLDWMKVPKILSGEWPKKHPGRLEREYYDEEVKDWFSRAMVHAPWLVCDCEWDPNSLKLTLLGLSYPGSRVFQWRNPDPLKAPEIWLLLAGLVRQTRMVYHNAKADIPQMERGLNIGWGDHKRGWDCTMQAHSKLWVEFPHTLDFVGSIYSDYQKRKHLQYINKGLYNEGDVVDTIGAWEGLSAELHKNPGVNVAYQDDLEVLPTVAESERIGIALDSNKVTDRLAEYRERVEIANRIAHSYCGYPINLDSNEQLGRWLYGIEQFPAQRKKKVKGYTVAKDAIAELRKGTPFDHVYEEQEGVSPAYIEKRIAEGAHPLLEAKKLFSTSRYVVSNYLKPLVGKKRVNHSIEIHTQDNFRWSYKRPPLATLPPDLRDMFVPDDGWPWFGWDWDGIELRLLACEARSRFLLDALAKRWDIHLLTAVDVFGLPTPPTFVDPIHAPDNAEWRKLAAWLPCDHGAEICGKDDSRRGFSKSFRYRRNYGGDPRFCMDIPGAVTLGLNSASLQASARRMDRRDPDLAGWWKRMDRQTRERGFCTDWRGRIRRLFEANAERRRRQAYDFGMQAGVQSLATIVINEIKRKFKDAVYYPYGMHDSQWWAIRERFFEEIKPQIREIATRVRVINGIEMSFPASFKERFA